MKVEERTEGSKTNTKRGVLTRMETEPAMKISNSRICEEEEDEEEMELEKQRKKREKKGKEKKEKEKKEEDKNKKNKTNSPANSSKASVTYIWNAIA